MRKTRRAAIAGIALVLAGGLLAYFLHGSGPAATIVGVVR